MDLDAVLDKLEGLTPSARKEVDEQVKTAFEGHKFIPSPGPQTEAWFCKADLLLYGGEGGGGKTGLLCGLALAGHKRTLLMRRQYSDHIGTGGIIDEMKRMNGGDGGFNGSAPATLRTSDDRVITFGGAANAGDEQRFQGKARDFLGIDEAAQFTESQVRFLMGWVRTTIKGQRARTVLASNAPIDNVGDWLVDMFRPWLDPTHHNPATDGELRWFITVGKEGAPGQTEDIEVGGPDPVEHNGEVVVPSSRTFIRASLKDNPFLGPEYQKALDALPEPYRSAVRDGNFMSAKVDHAFQVIPTQWIREAQARWTPEPPEHAPMSVISADIAQGGSDTTTIVSRYDGWFSKADQTPGAETPTGNEVAGLLISKRRNGCTIIIDMGGGYGGGTKMRLNDSGIDVVSYKGSESAVGRSIDQQYGFYNVRSKAYWKLREALDPSQDGGSSIALPDDPELVSDLTTPHFKIVSRGIQITPKVEVVATLRRSPDKGDATVMANFTGPKLQTHGNQWRKYANENNSSGSVTVDMGAKYRKRRK